LKHRDIVHVVSRITHPGNAGLESDLVHFHEWGTLPDETPTCHGQEGVHPVLIEVLNVDDRISARLLPGH
jgi:hypothetical protein